METARLRPQQINSLASTSRARPPLPHFLPRRPLQVVRSLPENIDTDVQDPQDVPPQLASQTRPRRSRRRAELETTPQHFGGALTTLLFGAVLLSERLNGVGIVQALELQNKGFHPFLLGSILVLMVAAAWPEERERGNPPTIVRVQMAAARVAYLGLAGTIAAEIFTGKGILSLLDIETGVEVVSDAEAVLAFLACLILTGPNSKRVR